MQAIAVEYCSSVLLWLKAGKGWVMGGIKSWSVTCKMRRVK
jgi:hypothetical protein